jgi:hypothetical protein
MGFQKLGRPGLDSAAGIRPLITSACGLSGETSFARVISAGIVGSIDSGRMSAGVLLICGSSIDETGVEFCPTRQGSLCLPERRVPRAC